MLKLDKVRQLIDIEHGLKRKWVAQRIGMTEGSFKQVICGYHGLSLKKTIELAKLLNVNLYDIWTDHQNS